MNRRSFLFLKVLGRAGSFILLEDDGKYFAARRGLVSLDKFRMAKFISRYRPTLLAREKVLVSFIYRSSPVFSNPLSVEWVVPGLEPGALCRFS